MLLSFVKDLPDGEYDAQQVKLEKIEFEEIIFIYSFKICQASDIFCILYIFLIIFKCTRREYTASLTKTTMTRIMRMRMMIK